MNTNISAFMLERYRLGELSPEDHAAVTEAIAADTDLQKRLNDLDESDRELRLRYPVTNMGLRTRKRLTRRVLTRAALAAAVLLAVALPVFRFILSKNNAGTAIAAVPPPSQGAYSPDRPKGHISAGSELTLYLKENQENILPDQAVLREGSTVQLAYTVPAEVEHYGVIFSIDGRSAVTMHYPYRKGQSSLLVSGRRTFLNEAYILDDAPDYEVFVLVVSEEPLDTDKILREAQKMAQVNNTSAAIETIVTKSRTAFENCAVETVTILKKTK